MLIALFLGIAGSILTLCLLWCWRRPAWMGLSGKTLWDWMAMATNSSVLAIGTVTVSLVILNVEQRQAEELAVQNYLDRMGALLVSDTPEHRGVQVKLAQAQTAAIFHRVTGERTGRVLTFLDAVGMTGQFNISLEGADLRRAELKGLTLRRVDFESARLKGADLEDSDLRMSDFEEADLRGADLENTRLTGADFTDANVRGVDFSQSDLRGANLSEVKGLKAKQLKSSCFDATTQLTSGLSRQKVDPEICSKIDHKSTR